MMVLAGTNFVSEPDSVKHVAISYSWGLRATVTHPLLRGYLFFLIVGENAEECGDSAIWTFL